MTPTKTTEELAAERAIEHALNHAGVSSSLGYELAKAEGLKLFAKFIASQPQPAGAWMPIEAAPKTGRPLLLGYFNVAGKWRTLRGEWFSREVIDEQWENAEDCDEGWYETPVEGEDYLHKTEPTHFQLLPAPPGALPAPQASAQGAAPVEAATVAGALFDFMGFLTTSEEQWRFSAYDDAAPGVYALEQWADKRGFALEPCNVAGWRAALASQPPAAAEPVAVEAPMPELTDERIMHLQESYVGSPNESYPLTRADWINFARAVLAEHAKGRP